MSLYRHEIDGLRALAIISVLVFHFFPYTFKLGYLGVDVFFVISGYLITLYILNRNGNEFSLRMFYVKRIKRLFPALFTCILITTFFVNVLYIKVDKEQYLQSLIATQSLLANLFFWRDGGYFGSDNELKPLLHMWSLSVEEQFYIIYPSILIFILYVANKYKNLVLLFLCAATFMSLSLWYYLNNNGGEGPAFFLIPTRAWQFGFGAIVAYAHHNHAESKIYEFKGLSYISAFLLLLGFLYPYSQVINTLLVTLGTALFIVVLNKENNIVFKVFSTPPAIFIGKISYSVYLYHWPIAVFILYFLIDKPSFLFSLLGLILSFIVGWISYVVVEVPFRHTRTFKHTAFLVLTCSFISTVGTVTILQYNPDDFVSNLARNNGTTYRCDISDYIPYGGSRACKVGVDSEFREIAILGNSHAQMYSPIIDEILLLSNKSGYLIPLNGCLPTTTVNLSKHCLEMANNNLNAVLSDRKINKVIVASTWYENTYTDINNNEVDFNELVSSFNDLIDKLEAGGKSVSLISPIKTPGDSSFSQLPRRVKFGYIQAEEVESKVKYSRLEFDDKFGGTNELFKERLNSAYIETYRDLCDENYCYTGRGDELYFADSSHLSRNSLINLKITKSQLSYFINMDNIL